MVIKYTPLGLMIYAAMTLWLVAFAGYIAALFQKSWRWLGTLFFGLGFLALVAAFVIRWIEVDHAPLQNMFEVVLCMSVLMFPLWLFCEKMLGAKGAALGVLLGLILLVPLGFVDTPKFSPAPQVLPPALQSWLFIPHVGSYMVAYVVLILVWFLAWAPLVLGNEPLGLEIEASNYRMIKLGFPLLTLGLLLGAVWGKLAWGDYWNWDPKELWGLASFLAYVVYLHVRAQYGVRFVRLNSVLALAGGLLVVITLLLNFLPKLFPGLHAYAMS